MVITANTKIAAILKHHPAALEAIISLSPKFEKLRNPILRKLMAGRASVSTASKIGGCSINEFFKKLQPLGFNADDTVPIVAEEKQQAPDFIKSLTPNDIVILDVRPVIASGKDPLNIILEQFKSLQPGQVLKLLNSFEPMPLMLLLQKQGFNSWANEINNNLVETWFYCKSVANVTAAAPVTKTSMNWDEILAKYNNRLQTVDVRGLEMPLPMMTIVEALDGLVAGTALYVYHKRIPVFLLPELAQRKFVYRIKEVREGEVHLLIFNT
ncbi:DUF2249 domain-containing protein [Niastella sp. OAS944]|uniref:DUF2249 domain-containing protein n=1 Tax=Niastella sp. OAS944 TaxID=2664089 RepID=UPI00347535C3|nr:uncharacterized protein (DUF2249 family) [Chitinophagaceae bacterium OAS944]